MKKSIWLDLEETVINNWYDGMPIIETWKVKKWLQENTRSPNVNIFSYAIYDESDKSEFVFKYKSWLEQELEIIIDEFPSVEDVIKSDNAYYETTFDFTSTNPKWIGFQKYVIDLELTDTHFILIDDCVPNLTMHFKDSGNIIEMINVKTL